MPSESKSQARLMAGVAHDPKFAKKVGIPQKVGKDFNQADKGTGILKGKSKKPEHKNKPQASKTKSIKTSRGDFKMKGQY